MSSTIVSTTIMSTTMTISSARPGRAGSGAARNILLAAALAAVLAGGDAAAQKSPSPKNQSPQNQGPANALQGFSQNRDQPVNIQSDTLVVRDKEKIATFSGNVHLIQGDTEMYSKSLVVHYLDESKPGAAQANALKAGPGASPDAAEQRISRVEATGGVTVMQKDQNAKGEEAVLDVQANTVVLSGHPVVMTRGQDVLRGQRLRVDLTTGVSTVEGGGGRVEVLMGTPPTSGGTPGLPGLLPAPPPAH